MSDLARTSESRPEAFPETEKSRSLRTTNYLYDGINLLEEVDSSGNVLARYSQGPNVDEPIAEVRSGATNYYESDGLGSVTSLTGTSGTIGNTYAYDSFGNLSSSTGFTTNPFRYTSREFDSETGLYYYRARYYDPSVGRFLSEDPLMFAGGIDFYAYVTNNPVLLIDPFGLRDPTPQEMQNIINAARDWANSNVPYVYGGKSKKGADCSGSVWGIYGEAGLPYDYTPASGFPKNPRFVPVPPGEEPQPGDVGWYPGHVVVYDPNAGQDRDVWSASHTGGPAFGPGNSSWYGKVKWYRYDVPEQCNKNSCSSGQKGK
jgi:RHS repeat-associated protein